MYLECSGVNHQAGLKKGKSKNMSLLCAFCQEHVELLTRLADGRKAKDRLPRCQDRYFDLLIC